MEKVTFDPVLGAKILGEIQAEGLRAAGALVERLVHLVDGPIEDKSEPSTNTVEGPSSAVMGAVGPWFDLWRELVERTTETIQRLQGGDLGPTGDGVRLGVDGGLIPARPLVIKIGADASAHGEMWLHNGTPDDHGALVPHCGPLSDVNGAVLAASIDIDPPRVDALHSRSSRAFVITATTEPTVTPGTYRGVVQVGGAEAVWMPLEIVVEDLPA